MITAVKFTISYSDRFLPPKNDLLILKIFEYCDRRVGGGGYRDPFAYPQDCHSNRRLFTYFSLILFSSP